MLRVCPKCGKIYSGHPALSRRDNKTEICPDCGSKEGFADYVKYPSRRRGMIMLSKETINTAYHCINRELATWRVILWHHHEARNNLVYRRASGELTQEQYDYQMAMVTDNLSEAQDKVTEYTKAVREIESMMSVK